VSGADASSDASRGNPFGHIDLRVPSLADALPFYEALLPPLGFTARYDGGGWCVFGTTGALPAAAYFGVTESTAHTPNENRIAFWAADRLEVERVTDAVAAAGAKDVSGPKDMPYGPGYYASYFTDPAGNRFEVYHRPPPAG
jgi:catechol 2,3-dioxygenase-like lactoylglutathione lyase family enzyme